MLPINKILREFEETQNLDDPDQAALDGLTAFMVFGAGILATLSIVALLFG
jgi:hypothetical protein